MKNPEIELISAEMDLLCNLTREWNHNYEHIPYPEWVSLPGYEMYDYAAKKIFDLDRVRDLIIVKNLEPLQNLLEEFYRDRSISYDQIIMLSSYVTSYDLHSIGGFFQDNRSPEERALKLASYQEEMRAFGGFLKAHYLAR